MANCDLCSDFEGVETFYKDEEVVILQEKDKLIGLTKKHLKWPDVELQIKVVAKLVKAIDTLRKSYKLETPSVNSFGHWSILASKENEN